MTHCTYYDLLGISSDATIREITDAKIFLIKKFHPDANIDHSFNTTLYIQKILEAHRILSDPQSREAYDKKVENLGRRHKYHASSSQKSKEAAPEQPSFAPYWESANKLNELVSESIPLFQKQSRAKKKFLNSHFLHKTKKAEERLLESNEYDEELISIAHLLTPHITLLREAAIPEQYWFSDAMNWLLMKWSQNRDLDFHLLFPMYDTCIQTYKSETEQSKLNHKSQKFLSNLEKLLKKRLDT